MREHGADAVMVRPFTVYGPGQRPEMAFARWIDCLDRGGPLPWHAAPGTARDFTYVDDAVAGILAALRRGRAGEAYNLSGWRSVDLREALGALEDAFGCRASLATTPGSARRGSRHAGLRAQGGRRAGLRAAHGPRHRPSAAAGRGRAGRLAA